MAQKYIGDICRLLHLQSNDVNADIAFLKLYLHFKDDNKKFAYL